MDQAFRIAERVARACVPELAGLPLYIVQPRADSMVTSAMLGDWSGCFFRRLDVALRSELERQGRWQGRGVAFVIDADAIRRRWPDAFSGERAIVGAVLHELAHWLNAPEATPPSVESPAEAYREFTEACARPTPPTPIPAAFWSHGAGFTRLACHLWHRARHGGGYSLTPRRLLFAGDYPTLEALSRPPAYLESLADEMELCRGWPLRTIIATAPPAAFSDLWRTDTARIFERAAAAA
jgi:hypothetical protein